MLKYRNRETSNLETSHPRNVTIPTSKIHQSANPEISKCRNIEISKSRTQKLRKSRNIGIQQSRNPKTKISKSRNFISVSSCIFLPGIVLSCLILPCLILSGLVLSCWPIDENALKFPNVQKFTPTQKSNITFCLSLCKKRAAFYRLKSE